MSPSVSIRLLLTQSDARLVAFASAGHERAFEALVQRYRRPLLGYCRRLLLSGERAEDALQQALLQAWLALRDGAQVGDVRPWLYRIVHNCAIDALRASGYDFGQLSESLTGAGAPQDDLDRRIAVREALAGLAALPQMQREALLRTAVEGGTHEQVAHDLGLSEPALRGLVYRARVALRAAAGAILPPPAVSWALEAGSRGAPVFERIAGAGAGGGSAGLAGLLVKGGAVAVTAGALAGGIVVAHSHRGLAGPASARAASPSAAKAAQSQLGAGPRGANADAPGGSARAVRSPSGARAFAQPRGLGPHPHHASAGLGPDLRRGSRQTGASHEHGEASKDASGRDGVKESALGSGSTLKAAGGGKDGSSTGGSGGSTGSTGGDGSSSGSGSGGSSTSEPTTSTQDGGGSSGGSGGSSDGGTQTQPTGMQMSSPDGSGSSSTTSASGPGELGLVEAPTDK